MHVAHDVPSFSMLFVVIVDLLLIFFVHSLIRKFEENEKSDQFCLFLSLFKCVRSTSHIHTHRTPQKLNETIAFVCVYNSRWREVCLLSLLITKNVCVAFFRIIISRFVQVLVIVRATSETFKPHNRIETGNSFLCSNKSN